MIKIFIEPPWGGKGCEVCKSHEHRYRIHIESEDTVKDIVLCRKHLDELATTLRIMTEEK